MKKDYYTFKELIMGSRSEYLKNQEYLKLLKQISIAYDKGIKDYYFLIEKNTDNIPESKCKFIKELRTLEELIEYIQNKYRKYREDETITTCLKNNNGDYIIKSNEGQAIRINNHNKEKFNEIVNKIFTSDFINKLNFMNYYERKNFYYNLIRISENEIYLEKNDNEESNPKFYFNALYNAKKDAIFMQCYKYYEVNEDLIDYILKFRIPADILSEYHKKIIDNNNDTNKNIKIEIEDYGLKRAKLIIEDNKDLITLRKVKMSKTDKI